MRNPFWALAVFASIFAVNALAQQSASGADNAARQALSKRDYAGVIAAYKGLPPEELSDQALYRLAIANQKSGSIERAQVLLRAALALNPKGTFASSPERLNALKSDVLFTPLVTEAVPESVSATKTVADINPSLTETAAVTATATASPTKAPIAIEPVPIEQAPLVRPHGKSWSAYLLMTLMMVSLVALAGAMIFRRQGAPWWSIGGRFALVDAADRQLALVRDQSARLIHQLESVNAMDTELYAALTRLLPVIEREAGRARYRKTGQAIELQREDQKVVAAMSQLEKSPLLLSSARQADIAAVFQSRRRPI